MLTEGEEEVVVSDEADEDGTLKVLRAVARARFGGVDGGSSEGAQD